MKLNLAPKRLTLPMSTCYVEAIFLGFLLDKKNFNHLAVPV